MDRMWVMVCQNNNWIGIKYSAVLEVAGCGNCPCKIFVKGNIPDNCSDKIPWNKMCVDFIGPYIYIEKGASINYLKFLP